MSIGRHIIDKFTQIPHVAAGPAGSSIQGTLYDPSAQVVTSSDVDFTIQIFDKNKTCVLYEEAHTGVDLSTTNGTFALELGEGNSRANKIDNSSVLGANVFRNDVSSVTSGTNDGGGGRSGDGGSRGGSGAPGVIVVICN